MSICVSVTRTSRGPTKQEEELPAPGTDDEDDTSVTAMRILGDWHYS